MKKRFFIIIAAVIGLLIFACSHPVGGHDDDDDFNDPVNNNNSTAIIFDNTQGICAVSVYNDYRRRDDDKIADVPAGQQSAGIDWTPAESVPFYFSYTVTLIGVSGFSMNYVPEIGMDQKAVRIDEGVTTTISIPKLDETVSPDKLLSDKSFLLIQNNSSYSFQLHRGESVISPDNMPVPLVNSGERAQYTINPGSASPYQLLVGADYKQFSGSVASFEAGRVYSFIFDGNISLAKEVEIKLENVANSSAGGASLVAPNAPTVTASDGFLTLLWIAVQGAEHYEVYYSTAQQPPTSPIKTVTGTTTVLTGLTNKTTYYIWIKAVNSSGSSDYSPHSQGIPWPDNQVPAVPGTPVIIPGINQLTVNWEECGGAVSYEVYINASATRPSTPEITTDKTSAVIKNLDNNKIYYIWVRAVNGTGKSDYSQVETGTPTVPTRVPSAPARPALTVGSRKLTVSWNAVELAAAYEVWLWTSSDSAQAQKQGGDITGGVTVAVISGLENETVYYVWVKAKNVVGTSGFSPVANAKPSAFAELPLTPSAPTVTPGSRALGVSWAPAEGALSYEVWTGTSNNPASAQKYGADISSVAVALTGLTNETTYYIWIKAKNNIGTSDLSPRASGTPSAFAAIPPAPLAAPSVIAGSGQLTVNWSAVEGANSYEVWAGTSTNPTIASKRGNDVTGLSSVITDLTNGTTYYIWIKAKNTVGVSEFSPMATGAPSSFTVTPQAPAAPSVSVGNGQITVTWAAVEGTTAYEVWTGTANNSASATKNGADVTASLSATINGLANGTTYYVWLKAKNSVGTSTFSPVASGKPIANATAPVLSASDGQLSATWSAVAGADQYEVFCGTGVNPPQTASQTINAPTITAAISGLVNGTTYYVWVKPKNATGTGGASTVVSAKPIGNMGTVTLVSSNTQLTASWTIVAGAAEYDVYYSTGSTIPGSPAQTVTTTTATISGLTNGTTYYVWVKPKNANGSGAVNTTVNGVPMATPGNLTVSAGNQQITVSWSTVPGASGYEVYYGTTTTMPATPTDTVTGLNKTITSLTNGTTYYFWVKAVNANGTGAASTVASGKPLGTPGAPTVSSDYRQLLVTWTAVPGANEYEVYYGTGSTPTTLATTVTGTSAAITGLTAGTTYNVRLRAKNANGVSDYGPNASGTPDNIRRPGLYRNAAKVGNQNLADSLTYITTNAVTNDDYYIVLGADESVSPKTLDYSGKTLGITLLGYSVERTITINATGYLFTINTGVTLTLGENITLVGRSPNYSSLVSVGSSGKFIMNYGAKITGNTNSNIGDTCTGGGVRVSGGTFTMSGGKISGNTSISGGGGVYLSGGTFTMSGGEISGNTTSSSYAVGGGVFVGGTAIFTKSGGGTITGYASDTVNGNVVKDNSGVAQSNRGHAVYVLNGMRREPTAGPGINLDSRVIGAAGGWENISVGTLAVNTWVDGSIAVDGDQWFSFTATAATQYIHLEPVTLSIGIVYLYDSSGTMVGSLASFNSSTESASWTVTNGSVYYIRVTSSNSYSGAYRIAFNASFITPPGSATALTVNTWTDGSIAANGVQWFRFTATAATQYIHFEPGGLNEVYVQLYDSNVIGVGSSTIMRRGSTYTSQTITNGSVYYIKVTPNSSSDSGAYKIGFTATSTAPPITLPTTGITALTISTWANGSIAANGVQWFSFTATADTQYIHFERGTLNDVHVKLYDSGGIEVGSLAELYGSQLYTSRTVTSGGVYYIRVWPFSSSGSGAYRIGFTTSITAPTQ